MTNVIDYIKDVWQVETEILDVIDKVCEENNLKYSLAYGTLIGAVRHKGFIPWDDDIDIVMPVKDYEKLLEIWDDVAPEGYLLQNKKRESDFTQNFSKIRKDHTAFLEYEEERTANYHKGIFVDIFPGYRVAPGKISRKMQYIACAVNLLYSREFTSGSGGLIGFVEKILIHFPGKIQKKLLESSNKFIARWSSNDSLDYFFPNTIGVAGHYYPAELFDKMTKLTFEGKEYSCVDDWDNFLKKDYGDYMQLPPESERTWAHHPLLIDFEHNYEELK